jgi:hypothetical protein
MDGFDIRGVIGLSDKKYHPFLLDEVGRPFRVLVATFHRSFQA